MNDDVDDPAQKPVKLGYRSRSTGGTLTARGVGAACAILGSLAIGGGLGLALNLAEFVVDVDPIRFVLLGLFVLIGVVLFALGLNLCRR